MKKYKVEVTYKANLDVEARNMVEAKNEAEKMFKKSYTLIELIPNDRINLCYELVVTKIK